jgi:hypothetical protein
MADTTIAETFYEIRLPRGAVIERFVVRADSEDAAIAEAQNIVDNWRFKVQRERGRIVVRQSTS